MLTISLCMIVKNEAAVLARCLESVKDVVDEIVIVDTGSTDETKEIAARYTDQVYDFVWVQDFSAARNAAFGYATKDYQLWLDADDVLPPEEAEKLCALKESLPQDIDLVTMKYHTHFDDSGAPVFTATRERLLRREAHFRWQDPVHECIALRGRILHADIAIWHKKPKRDGVPSTRNLDIYRALERKAAPLTPRQQYYFARELKDHEDYAKAAYYFQRFLAEGKGWVEDNIGACLGLAICYKQIGESSKVLPTLTRSFQYDAPRGELCTEIGYYYKDRAQYRQALHWFQLAEMLPKPDTLGFVSIDHWGYIPAIEACVCACHLQAYELARSCNQRAAFYKPGDAAVLHNDAFLAEKQKQG